MTNPIGVYWSVMHRRPQDYDYFKRLQPSVFKIMDGGQPDYQFARDHLPNSLVIARDWALSEQHSDMLKDPIATGKRHAQEWNGHQQRLGFDKAKTLILGVNEPRVWEPGVPEALRRYTIALCDEATVYGLRVGAMQLSVGWPNNTGPDTPPDWSPFHGVDNAIRANNGALVTHEYFADNGPGENWGWWCGRTLKCPWQVPIVIGEAGVDMYVKDSSVAHANRGWRGHMDAEQYARYLADYVGRMSADKRFVGCCVFASDFANREWFSFDVEPAYAAILAQSIPKHTQHIPSVIAPGPTPPKPPTGPSATVTAPAGANIRTGPGLEYPIRGAESRGMTMAVIGRNREGDWWQITMPHATGWVYAMVVETQDVGSVPVVDAPAPEPTPPVTTPAGDDWPRIYAFIKRWEGGWADHPNDPGGATNKGVTFATFKRWRESRGMGTPTLQDLREVRDAEVEQIFYEWYYLAAGANAFPFPLSLAVADLAVNGGVGRAQQALNEAGHDFLKLMAWRIDWYTRISNFEHFGKAWVRRCADVLREGST